jgi:hypothetical protein
MNCAPPADIGSHSPQITIAVAEDDDQVDANGSHPSITGQIARRISDHFAVSFVQNQDIIDGSGYYYQYYYSLDQQGTWHRHRWFMVGCHDYTNLHALNASGKQILFAPALTATPDVINRAFIALFHAN